jgi:hypothetical protein
MPLTTGEYALEAGVAKFFRSVDAFTSPSSGTAAREAQPGDDDEGWIDLGIVQDVDIETTSEEIEVWKPTPGKLRLNNILELKHDQKIMFTLKDLSPLAVELMTGSGELDGSSTTFTPLARTGLNGWLMLDWYDQGDTERINGRWWVQLKVDGAVPVGGGRYTEVRCSARVLYSTLNEATLSPTADS